jgi:hypothetical protein
VAGRLVLGAAGVVVLAGLVVGGILLLRDGDDEPPTDYDARIEDDFMATCTRDAEDLGFTRAEDYCRCAYDGIREDVAFDRFLEIDRALQDDPTAVPEQVDRIRTACYLEVEAGGAPTVPTTTEPT